MRRRELLKAAAAGAASYALAPALARPLAQATSEAAASTAPQALSVVRRTIEVNGKSASVYGLLGPDGKPGLRLRPGARFNVALSNRTSDPTIVHWHGLTPPWPSDGVQDAPQPLIAPGAERAFDFPVDRPGTYWMHAHTLQQQSLLTAPLIIESAVEASSDEQEVVVLLNDFSFKSPDELLAGLTGKGMPPLKQSDSSMSGMDIGGGSDMGGMDMSGSGAMGAPAKSGTDAMAMDINDIEYDAYLANDHTLDDPEIVPVEMGGRVRVRLINGAAATAFTIDFGDLEGTLIAVDGQDIVPVTGRRFPVSMGQRIDVRLQLPKEARSFPILALREGGRERTGIILRPRGANISKMVPAGETNAPILDLEIEARLRAAVPLPVRTAGKSFDMALSGDMAAYRWGLATQPSLFVERGDRVELTFRNVSMMAHPMHLHGHQFQVVAIEWQRFSGAMRDTVLVPPLRAVTIAVDADNPGQWAFHCHHLYHMQAGMMTTFSYRT